jgi:hypothetical protein
MWANLIDRYTKNVRLQLEYISAFRMKTNAGPLSEMLLDLSQDDGQCQDVRSKRNLICRT